MKAIKDVLLGNAVSGAYDKSGTTSHYMVVGLGNPGRKRQYSRHNAGQMGALLFFSLAGGRRFRKVGDAYFGDVLIGSHRVTVVLPRTAINLNGHAVARHASRLGIAASRVIVLHDDTGNKSECVTIGTGISSSSHKGLQSVAARLKRSEELLRVKVGIGAPKAWDLSFYLAPVFHEERKALQRSALLGAIAARLIIEQDFESAKRLLRNLTNDRWDTETVCEFAIRPISPSWATRYSSAGEKLLPIGAAMLRVGAEYWRKTIQRRVRIVTVIGTYGKSTTRSAIYRSMGPTLVGKHLRWWPQLNAREGPALHLLSIWPWRRYGVMEVSIGRLGGMAMETQSRILQPDVVVMTSIGSEHQEDWPDIESKVAEKGRMLTHLRSKGVFIANCDDPYVEQVAEKFHGRVLRFGLGEKADVRGLSVHLEFPKGTRFTVQIGETSHNLFIPAFGEHAVRAALATIAVAYAESMDIRRTLSAIEKFAPVAGRMSAFRAPNGAWVIRDDYKAPIETFDYALDVLETITASKKYIVAGDMDTPRGKQGDAYRHIGERIGKIATGLVIVGKNEEMYARAAIRGGMPRANVVALPMEYMKAAAYVRDQTGPGDVILIKGRGSDRVQRVSLALLGKEVRCQRYPCHRLTRCDKCALLVSSGRAS